MVCGNNIGASTAMSGMPFSLAVATLADRLKSARGAGNFAPMKNRMAIDAKGYSIGDIKSQGAVAAPRLDVMSLDRPLSRAFYTPKSIAFINRICPSFVSVSSMIIRAIYARRSIAAFLTAILLCVASPMEVNAAMRTGQNLCAVKYEIACVGAESLGVRASFIDEGAVADRANGYPARVAQGAEWLTCQKRGRALGALLVVHDCSVSIHGARVNRFLILERMITAFPTIDIRKAD